MEVGHGPLPVSDWRHSHSVRTARQLACTSPILVYLTQILIMEIQRAVLTTDQLLRHPVRPLVGVGGET